jgi:drug/metabolite transporter (DMT)-like permease
MKLNFWQILGILLLIVGIVLVFRKRIAPTDVRPPQNTTTNATTAPAPTTAP